MPTVNRRPCVPALLLVPALVISACAGLPPGTDPPAPTGTPAVEVPHRTGRADVILRLEEGGGFAPMEFFATQLPSFTLYGDGTVIYQPQDTGEPPPGPALGRPLHVATMPEDAVQALLKFAIAESGLGVAKLRYQNPWVADGPTTWFTIDVDGLTKTVEVYALGLDDGSSPDTPILRALNGLAERLRAFPAGFGSVTPVGPYEPAAYRGTLIRQDNVPGDPPRPWPWDGIAPTDFVEADGSFGPRRVLSAAEAGTLGIEGVESGVLGLRVLGPDGVTIYSFALRPLLPDEAA